MRKIIVNLAVSLDGLIEGPNGEYDWCFTDQDYGMKTFFERIDAVFLGRKSYELVTQTGPVYFGKIKQYVFSKTLKAVTNKTTTIINDEIPERVHAIKNEPGKDIWFFGGASLLTAFMNEKLIDELLLSVHPILLGKGKPLFQNIEPGIKLELLDVTKFSSGLVQLFYRVNK